MDDPRQGTHVAAPEQGRRQRGPGIVGLEPAGDEEWQQRLAGFRVLEAVIREPAPLLGGGRPGRGGELPPALLVEGRDRRREAEVREGVQEPVPARAATLLLGRGAPAVHQQPELGVEVDDALGRRQAQGEEGRALGDEVERDGDRRGAGVVRQAPARQLGRGQREGPARAGLDAAQAPDLGPVAAVLPELGVDAPDLAGGETVEDVQAIHRTASLRRVRRARRCKGGSRPPGGPPGR